MKMTFGGATIGHGAVAAATLVLLATTLACGNSKSAAPQAAAAPPEQTSDSMPPWVLRDLFADNVLCGRGVAGAGFNEQSPYPKQLSLKRAARNLAGILQTRVEEAIIDRNTTWQGNQIESARVLTLDESLVEQIEQAAQASYWIDKTGVGPFGQKNFTYAKACLDVAKAAGAFRLGSFKLDPNDDEGYDPDQVPSWIGRTGQQSGGRLCAVGYSLPAFFSDKTFENVISDVRGQLAKVIETFVSSYYEEFTRNQHQVVEAMTLASTQALSRGVIVTHYWYDRNGIGPHKRKETTYGWGCVYPVEVVKLSIEAAEPLVADSDQAVIAKVRQRAAQAFDDLESQISKSSP